MCILGTSLDSKYRFTTRNHYDNEKMWPCISLSRKACVTIQSRRNQNGSRTKISCICIAFILCLSYSIDSRTEHYLTKALINARSITKISEAPMSAPWADRIALRRIQYEASSMRAFENKKISKTSVLKVYFESCTESVSSCKLATVGMSQKG